MVTQVSRFMIVGYAFAALCAGQTHRGTARQPYRRNRAGARREGSGAAARGSHSRRTFPARPEGKEIARADHRGIQRLPPQDRQHGHRRRIRRRSRVFSRTICWTAISGRADVGAVLHPRIFEVRGGSGGAQAVGPAADAEFRGIASQLRRDQLLRSRARLLRRTRAPTTGWRTLPRTRSLCCNRRGSSNCGGSIGGLWVNVGPGNDSRYASDGTGIPPGRCARTRPSNQSPAHRRVRPVRLSR